MSSNRTDAAMSTGIIFKTQNELLLEYKVICKLPNGTIDEEKSLLEYEMKRIINGYIEPVFGDELIDEISEKSGKVDFDSLEYIFSDSLDNLQWVGALGTDKNDKRKLDHTIMIVQIQGLFRVYIEELIRDIRIISDGTKVPQNEINKILKETDLEKINQWFMDILTLEQIDSKVYPLEYVNSIRIVHRFLRMPDAAVRDDDFYVGNKESIKIVIQGKMKRLAKTIEESKLSLEEKARRSFAQAYGKPSVKPEPASAAASMNVDSSFAKSEKEVASRVDALQKMQVEKDFSKEVESSSDDDIAVDNDVDVAEQTFKLIMAGMGLPHREIADSWKPVSKDKAQASLPAIKPPVINLSSIDSTQGNYHTLLTEAVSKGDLDQVISLIELGASVNSVNVIGDTPAHCAARVAASKDRNVRVNGYAILCYLVSKGADLKSKNRNGESCYDLSKVQTQLTEIISTCDVKKVESFLLEAHGVVSLEMQPSGGGQTPLTYAASCTTIEMVEYLIKCGAKISTVNVFGQTPAHCAAKMAASKDTGERARGYAILRHLVLKGADLKDKNRNNESCFDISKVQSQFMDAIGSCDVRKVETFLRDAQGVVIMDAQPSGGGQTPLTYAASCTTVEMVEYLIKCGAKVSIANIFGQTPAHCAAKMAASKDTGERARGYAILRHLVLNGADLKDKNRNNESCFDISKVQSQFMDVIASCDVRKVETFLRDAQGVVIMDGQPTGGGQTPLTYAASCATVEMVEYLIKCGAKISTANIYGQTPAHCAAKMAASKDTGERARGYAILRHLVLNGADLKDKNRNNESCFDISKVQSQFTDVIASCDVRKVETFLRDAQGVVIMDAQPSGGGQTPLTYAASCATVEIVEYLIKCGAKISTANVYGQTPAHCAAKVAASKDTSERARGYAILRHLVLKGADLKDKNRNNESCFDISKVQSQFTDVIASCDVRKVETFLRDAQGVVSMDAQPSGGGQTPLTYAASCTTVEMVEYLIKCGAKVSIANIFGNTPAHCAAKMAASKDTYERARGYAILRLLALNGADLKNKNRNNETCFDISKVQSQFLEVIGSCDVRKVETFLRDAQGVVSMDKQPSGGGQTPLTYAASCTTVEMVEYLKKCGAIVSKANIFGNTPAHCAAKMASSKDASESKRGYLILSYLQSVGADLNALNRSSQSCAAICDLRFLPQLASAAVSKPSINLPQTFFSNSNVNEQLLLNATNLNIDEVQKLLYQGVEADYVCKDGNPIITYLIMNKDISKALLKIIRLLLVCGADPRRANNDHVTALECLLEKDNQDQSRVEKLCQLLLDDRYVKIYQKSN